MSGLTIADDFGALDVLREHTRQPAYELVERRISSVRELLGE